MSRPVSNTFRLRFRRTGDDEKGAILVLSIVGVVLAMIFSAMAVDLGFTAQEARRNQKVADLAALDAVRDLVNHQMVASTSANTRNQFPSTGGYTVVSSGATAGERRLRRGPQR